MESDNFLKSLPFILRWEGGYVNHPDDPGGATNKGVTQKTYDAWRIRLGLSKQDVRQLEDKELNAIYESGYWLPPHCNELGDPLDLVQFDTSVNMGVKRAVRMLQAALDCGVDGSFGPKTLDAVMNCNPGITLVNYCDHREKYYRDLAERRPKLKKFLKGWLNRLNALRHEVGLPGVEVTRGIDLDGAGYTRRIPDVGENSDYDI